MAEKDGRSSRYANWTFIFYEESAPNWREELEELCIPVLVSPVHDSDVWTAKDEEKNPDHKAGMLKKPHRHGIIMYGGQTKASYEDVLNDLHFLHSKNVKRVKSVPSMVAYLTHEGTPTKAQYSCDGVLEFGGADYHDLRARQDDDHWQMQEMRKCANEYWVDFDQFWLWCDNCKPEWSKLLDSKCYGIERFLKAKRGRLKTLGLLAEALASQPPIDCSDLEGWGLSTTPTPGESKVQSPEQVE